MCLLDITILKSFQYPLSDRLRWNLCLIVMLVLVTIFQYPLSDRLRWNPINLILSQRCRSTFSILYRIDFVGTTIHTFAKDVNEPAFSILYRIDFVGTPTQTTGQNFQYPLSDRLRWNVT